ncbi:MAG: polyprenyl synthetase family protein [Syntrophomonadaceae bacterium]|nr:polyprenyl synthetase family protein [Syntrophomonadaceae bacterium]MDD3023474.1 polyprenyl synthetase family protein [Syntrophomonadaceae bacterium]
MSKLKFFSPISEEMRIVEDQLSQNIDSNIEILNEASLHLIKAGGKRLRPAFTLLSARLFTKDLNDVIPIAVALELIHMASLVHDDVIDNSDTRRGSATVRSAWGNRVSIYAGDYILARALSMAAKYQRRDIVDVLADTSMKICEGEVIQMLSCYNVTLGLKNYLRRIERKTALLISVSCQLGAMVVNASQQSVKAVKDYGYYLGMAFQVTDDILDIISDEQVLGKPTGSDIRQGVITLPALYALNHSPHGAELARLLSSPESCADQTDRIINMIVDSEGIDYAYYITRHYARKAQQQLKYLPDVAVKKNLYNMADFILARDF